MQTVPTSYISQKKTWPWTFTFLIVFSLFWDTILMTGNLSSGSTFRGISGPILPYKIDFTSHRRWPRNRFFKIYIKFNYFTMVFSLFWDTASIASISPSGDPLWIPRVLKTNYMLNLDNYFLTTIPISDLKVSLDKACQGLKL